MYRCTKCGEESKEIAKGLLRCPVCAHKVLLKMREPITKEINAR